MHLALLPLLCYVLDPSCESDPLATSFVLLNDYRAFFEEKCLYHTLPTAAMVIAVLHHHTGSPVLHSTKHLDAGDSVCTVGLLTTQGADFVSSAATYPMVTRHHTSVNPSRAHIALLSADRAVPQPYPRMPAKARIHTLHKHGGGNLCPGPRARTTHLGLVAGNRRPFPPHIVLTDSLKAHCRTTSPNPTPHAVTTASREL